MIKLFILNILIGVLAGYTSPLWGKPRVLYVDDTPMNLELIEAMLGSSKIDLVLYDSPEKVIAAVETGMAFDLILTDFNMPNMNGAQLADKLRSIGVKTPIALFSGESDNTLAPLKPLFTRIFKKPSELRSISQYVDSREYERKRIMLVHSYESTQAIFQEEFEKHGYKVDVAGTVEDAANKIANNTRYDFILVDEELPDRNTGLFGRRSIEFTKALGKNRTDLPIGLLAINPDLVPPAEKANVSLVLGINDIPAIVRYLVEQEFAQSLCDRAKYE